jgi:peptidoglycan/xylan/chitin deacetylase (PgdA/CDA1 family)
VSFLRRRWEKNWPEIRNALRGDLPPFILSARPGPLAGVPVFWYHTVEPEPFEGDLRFLADNGYTSLGADELLDHLSGRNAVASRSVVISIDDGAFNLYEVAFPAIRKFGFKAVAFVAPHFHDIATTTRGGARPCTWREIEEMHGSGLVDFQSHTFEHRYLPRWPEPLPLTGIAREHHRYRERQLSIEEDFLLAKHALESRLGKTIWHLAFPSFDGTAEAVRIGLACGYKSFWWGVQPGKTWNRPGDDGTSVVRLSGEFVRRLPGRGRRPLAKLLWNRYSRAARGWRRGS